MATRLGDVLYWLGCILAVLFRPLPLLALIDFVNGHHRPSSIPIT
jgi:hypothetical protein